MDLSEILEIYEVMACTSETIQNRTSCLHLRKQALTTVSENGMVKLAFDTRRIDQETEFNPRRGLQNYHRSEAFVSEALSQKLENFSKLRNVLDDLRQEFGREHEWQDSNARVLLNTLDNGLRTMIKDGDYATSQPAQGSLDYIEELLHVRYRLTFDDLTKMGESDLRRVILSKDEELVHRDQNKAIITKSDVAQNSYDSLIEKLFGGFNATKENPEVERTVTITIKDKFVG